jgi:hypothetical protein
MKLNIAFVWWFRGGEVGVVCRDADGRLDDIPKRAWWMPAAHRDFGKANAKLSMFVLFNTLVVRDKVDPQVAHQAFLAIDEYRKTISPDTPGAD